jgi:hypothetical protein
MADGDEPPHAYTTVEEVCNGIEEELKRLADFASETTDIHDTQAVGMRSAGKMAEELDAWRDSYAERKRVGELFALAGSYDTDRKKAPVYADKPEKWETDMRERIVADFPRYVTEHSKLYVEECENTHCVADETDA